MSLSEMFTPKPRVSVLINGLAEAILCPINYNAEKTMHLPKQKELSYIYTCLYIHRMFLKDPL